jgi:transposase
MDLSPNLLRGLRAQLAQCTTHRAERGKAVEEISVIGIDLAKSVFELCALSAGGDVVWTKRLKRSAFVKFMEDLSPRCVIGMEACGGSHYWGRRFLQQGFEVKLMAPRPVKAYRQGVHKNDARDARAIAEAASRSHVCAVRVKSEHAQLVQALVRIRTRRLRQMVQTANQLRGLLNEFGIVLPKGHGRMLAAIAKLRESKGLAEETLSFVDSLCEELVEQRHAVDKASRQLLARVSQEESCVRLMTIPNIGPINAATLSVALEVPAQFASGRGFAAQLCLIPRHAKSADSEKMLGIARQNANETRRHLVLAAQSLLTRLKRMKELPDDKFLRWALRLLERKNRNVAAVAVAAKLARIAWAIEAKARGYVPKPAA